MPQSSLVCVDWSLSCRSFLTDTRTAEEILESM
ncbi:hypothetical protein AAZX31_04G214300 [Glycine max]